MSSDVSMSTEYVVVWNGAKSGPDRGLLSRFLTGSMVEPLCATRPLPMGFTASSWSALKERILVACAAGGREGVLLTQVRRSLLGTCGRNTFQRLLKELEDEGRLKWKRGHSQGFGPKLPARLWAMPGAWEELEDDTV